MNEVSVHGHLLMAQGPVSHPPLSFYNPQDKNLDFEHQFTTLPRQFTTLLHQFTMLLRQFYILIIGGREAPPYRQMLKLAPRRCKLARKHCKLAQSNVILWP